MIESGPDAFSQKDVLGMKIKKFIESESLSSSITQPSEPEQLLRNLLQRQYPMAQDEPTQMPETPQASNQDYHARMDAWLEKYANEW